jgi:hypothetical protein
MHFLRGCHSILSLAADNKACLFKLGGLLLTVVVATTSWVLAVALGSHALGIATSALLLVGLGLVVAALCVVAAAAVMGDP